MQGQESAWFGAGGGCGHGMHPQCWMQYMTHSAQGQRHGASAQGHLYVQCPTCRRAVTGERAHEYAPGRPARTPEREQFERLALLGSEPEDPPIYIPRVPRIAFPEHVNLDDGRLGGPTRGGGQERGIPRASSRSSAPGTPPPTRPLPRPDGSQAISAPRGSRGQASGEELPSGRNWPRGGGAGDPEPSGGRSNGNDRDRGDRARGDGLSGGREEEQGEAPLTRGAVAVLGEAMRRVVDDPTLRQIFFGEYGGAARAEAGAHDADPTPRHRGQDGTMRHGVRATARVVVPAETTRADAKTATAATRRAADRAAATIAITATSHTAGTG